MTLKGISHLHTKYSHDGTLSIRKFKDYLLENDIEFALITEHSDFIEAHDAEKFIKDCHNLSDGKITLIPGFEVPYRDAHILMIGVDHFVKTGSCEKEDLIKWKKHAEFAVWAHPHKNKYLLYDAIKAVIDSVEVWNSQYDGKKAPRLKVLNSLQGLRARGHNTLAFCGLNFHSTEHISGPTIMVESVNRQTDILSQIKKGEFVLKSERITIASDGRIIKGIVPLMKIQSVYSISLIAGLEKVSAIVHNLRIPTPKSLRDKIRKNL